MLGELSSLEQAEEGEMQRLGGGIAIAAMAAALRRRRRHGIVTLEGVGIVARRQPPVGSTES